jgi:hypothetical protein
VGSGSATGGFVAGEGLCGGVGDGDLFVGSGKGARVFLVMAGEVMFNVVGERCAECSCCGGGQWGGSSSEWGNGVAESRGLAEEVCCRHCEDIEDQLTLELILKTTIVVSVVPNRGIRAPSCTMSSMLFRAKQPVHAAKIESFRTLCWDLIWYYHYK